MANSADVIVLAKSIVTIMGPDAFRNGTEEGCLLADGIKVNTPANIPFAVAL
jgi:hypothetical protein